MSEDRGMVGFYENEKLIFQLDDSGSIWPPGSICPDTKLHIRKNMITPIEILQEENEELKKLLLTPEQLCALAIFVNKYRGKLTESLLQELTPKYLRDRADRIDSFFSFVEDDNDE